jgi:hypothetical protein
VSEAAGAGKLEAAKRGSTVVAGAAKLAASSGSTGTAAAEEEQQWHVFYKGIFRRRTLIHGMTIVWLVMVLCIRGERGCCRGGGERGGLASS